VAKNVRLHVQSFFILCYVVRNTPTEYDQSRATIPVKPGV
jgi:hypothetical protein